MSYATRLQSAFSNIFRSVGNPGYRKFLFGQSFSQIGTWMQSVAQGLFVLKLGGSGIELGITVLLQVVPVAALAPIGGVWADQLDRRMLLIVSNLIAGLQALALGLLVASGQAGLPLVYAMALVLGIISAVQLPAQQAFLGEIVEEHELANAVNVNLMMTNVARIIGPAIAGFAVAGIGIAACFMLNAASFLAVIAMLVAIRPAHRQIEPRSPPRPGQLAQGIAHVRQNRDLAAAWWMNLVYCMLAWQFEVSVPLLVTETFGGSAEAYGFMFSALGIGAVVGGAWGASRTHPTNRDQLLAATVSGLGLFATALAPNLAVAFVTAAIGGGAMVCWWGLLSASFQVQSDPAFRARVMGLWMTGLHGGRPLGALLVGWLAVVLGGRAPFVLGGIGCILAILLWSRISGHSLREAFTSRTPIPGHSDQQVGLRTLQAEAEMIGEP